MGRLTGKVALITGASRGIGAGIAEAFASEGADLIINYRTNDEAAFRVVSKLKNLGRKVVAIRADVSKRSEIQNLIHLAQIEFGRIDILVNNAGINQRGWFDEVTDEAWDMIMGTNLKGPFMCCQEVFPLMKANGGGRIINISSVAGQYHGPKTVHYAVSKAGLNSLTKVLARYGAEYNVLVNAVAPGLVRTDQTADEIDSPAGARVLDMTLLKKAGRIEDISSACVFLASDEQQYMTGQILAVSGGAILDN
ncbi:MULTISPECIES: 3-oxoacyl-ACP reductase family protein [Shewanella]|uniref:3-oxoacyl-ACP reductase FabG n=1 Tax=Shewanella oncorhynchi TaxID=2726434 RepID=A0ABX1KL18_9GAMM|nr:MULTISPECIES: 3-oxoacyl-ACP reductase family protein [unclassified Shewanella]MBW3531036.1 3-oxoacyl-ACP reductase FabG [Shewanella sp. NKUCC06_TVS]MCU8059927.1 3-oxoacyl-ACP reductase FabG [Shewanella sp. SM55]MCU8087201.1 3-oxoacyl-ACP reductase FabG [Shewanella sp. SM21]NLQ22883.1 3-oxoacyl-ACP reductase FabG [Shewanella oncorhynchi]